ncbi:hypothetical protein [Roseisalinus antarcticus]|uniref:Uncharacterized protein n=1 Tax=Roseisalinus antarcticus TaxID=254357 RepID=A0A1Y5RBZ6_9RHOB|nr:hypothetical protein [Roseisalinus antarcticus]SLN13778.1 hypothetical protein ROA7023_00081 [Roseisalinus antarcticus]
MARHSSLAGLALILVAGCSSGVPEAADFVRTTSGSSFIGETEITIFDGDFAQVFAAEPHGARDESRTLALPDGSYARARALVEAGFPAVLAAQAAETDPPVCPTDMGADVITVRPAVAGTERIAAGCGDTGVRALMGAIGGLVPR